MKRMKRRLALILALLMLGLAWKTEALTSEAVSLSSFGGTETELAEEGRRTEKTGETGSGEIIEEETTKEKTATGEPLEETTKEESTGEEITEEETTVEDPAEETTEEETIEEETTTEEAAEESTAGKETKPEDFTETEETKEAEDGTEPEASEETMEAGLYGAAAPEVYYSVHMQTHNWQPESGNGTVNGKPGAGKRIESIRMRIAGVSGLGVNCQVYNPSYGWRSGKQWVDPETKEIWLETGTTGEAKRIEAFKINLTGDAAGKYDIYYRVYASDYGWLGWAKNGEEAGVDTSWNKCLDAIEVRVQAKENRAPESNLKPYLKINPEEGYPNTHKNTGNRIQDLIAVAKTQVGYSKAENTPTKYGTWYNAYVNATGDYYPSAPWCAMFISWCAEQAKIPNTIFRMHSATWYMTAWYKNNNNPGVWHERGSYTPKAGDLIFFKFGRTDREVDHVGIVTGVSGGKVYTVEGNTSNSVRERSYSLGYEYIKGYATPDYEETGITAAPDSGGLISYRANVEGKGWDTWKSDGEEAGTTGSAKMLKALKVQLSDAISGGITYRSHMQTYGWQGWSKDGAVTGIADGSKRMEAVEIKLTGEAAQKYDVYYRVHCQSFGWMGWAKNGESAGSEGYAKRVEAVEIRLVRKGGAAPGSTSGAFLKKPATVSYSTHVQTYGWLPFVENGAASGTTGEAKRLEGIQIRLENTSGNISYRTHVQTYGWSQGWMTNGAVSGTTGEAKRLEAIEIKLSGEAERQFDIYYRVHCQTYGWMGWAKNGEAAGTSGMAKRLESIEIRLVPKGGQAPGSTAGHYLAG